MNRPRKIFMIIVMFGLVYYSVHMRYQRPGERVSSCHPEAVTSITFEHDGAQIKLSGKAEDNNWLVFDGQSELPANPAMVEAYRAMICYLPFIEERKLETPMEDLVGTHPPKVIVEAKKPFTYLIGEETTDKENFYLYSSQKEKNIFSIPIRFKRRLMPNATDLLLKDKANE